MYIAVDAGHGHNTSGKRVPSYFKEFSTAREWDLNSKIAELLTERLKESGVKVIRVDDVTGKKDVALSQRVKTANTEKVDLYIAIHHNAGINGGSGGGVEVYTLSDLGMPRANALYSALVKANKNKGNRANPVRANNLYVLKYTTMPALYIENGFMDSSTDIMFLDTDDYRINTVNGICGFLNSHYGLTLPTDALGSERCHCGCPCCSEA